MRFLFLDEAELAPDTVLNCCPDVWVLLEDRVRRELGLIKEQEPPPV